MRDFVKNRVIELFGEGKLYCAETVLKVVAEGGGRDPADVTRLATGYCSGMARTCGQCGAVSGAVMGIGLFAGRDDHTDDYEPAYAMVQEFLDRFTAKCGSTNCYELIGCDFATPEGQERFKQKKLLRKCIIYAVYAAETALDILRENGYVGSWREVAESRIAPCGLACGKCLAFGGGEIQRLSQALGEQLGDNFAAYAERLKGMNPIFEHYESFREFLDFMARGSCGGCRDAGCLFKECTVPACAREHGVTYCFQCDEFPCDKHGMPDGLAERWEANNETMLRKGLDVWYGGCLERHRYP